MKDLFRFFMEEPNCLPSSWYEILKPNEHIETVKARLIADYIAGMTDRFAVKEHGRLFSAETTD